MTTSGVSLPEIVTYLDGVLDTTATPDYPGAVNGLQVEGSRPIRHVAVSVDASLATIDGAIAAGAELLVVHHGLFWSDARPLRGTVYERFRRLLVNDVAVYSSHLPLDRHPDFGNNILFARALALEAREEFARFQSIAIGVAGKSDVETEELVRRAGAIARLDGGAVTAVGVTPGRRTRRWAVCTGAGASSATLREASEAGIDTLIVGEGPHHTAVEAQEMGIAMIYAGHYVTETFGVRALGAELSRRFGVTWSFVAAPTGL